MFKNAGKDAEIVDLNAVALMLGRSWSPKAGIAYNEILQDPSIQSCFRRNLFYLFRIEEIGPDDPSKLLKKIMEVTGFSEILVKQFMLGSISLLHASYLSVCLNVGLTQLMEEELSENLFLKRADASA